MALHDRIRQARKEAGMTQDALALALRLLDPRLAKTKESGVSMWENGAPRLSFYVVDAVAKATGKPLAFFSEHQQDEDAAVAVRPRGAGGGDEEARPPLAERVRVIQAAIQDLVDQARREAGDD